MSIRFGVVMLWLALLSLAPLHAQSTIVELNDAAWKKLQNDDGAAAARLFAEALNQDPGNPVLLYGAGVAARVEGKPKEALGFLQRALEGNPRLTQASLLLGQIAYDEGDVALAIATYEKALKYAPNDATLTKGLKAWRTDAETHRGFEERKFDRFRVMFQGRADEPLAATATEILNSAFWDIGRELGGYPADAVVVMLYTEQQFRDVTRAPEWAGGVYDGRIRVPTAGATRSPELFERVLVHELAHAVIAKLAPEAPAWLHEGLAQHFEGEDSQAARRRLKAAGRTMPLRTLERSFVRFSAADAQVAYDESLVAVDAILQRPGFSWIRLFRALSENNRTEATFSSFGFSYADLEAGFAR